MQTTRLPGCLAPGAAWHSVLSSGPQFLWTELKTYCEGGFQLATVKCCWQPINESREEKSTFAQCFSQSPVSMGTRLPWVVFVSEWKRYSAVRPLPSSITVDLCIMFHQLVTSITWRLPEGVISPLPVVMRLCEAVACRRPLFLLSLREGGILPPDHLPA